MRILDIINHLNTILASFGNVEAKIAVGINKPERHEIVGILPMELRDKGEAYLPFLMPTFDETGAPYGPTGPTGQMPDPELQQKLDEIPKKSLFELNEQANKIISEGLISQAEKEGNLPALLEAIEECKKAQPTPGETFYTSGNPGDLPSIERGSKQSSFTFYRDKDNCLSNAQVGRMVYECIIRPIAKIVKTTEPIE